MGNRLLGCGPVVWRTCRRVWLTDFGANAFVRFDPRTERFATTKLPSSPANVRQLLGRPGEVWGAESAADKLVVMQQR